MSEIQEEFDTQCTHYPVCPNCGEEFVDAWEWKGDQGEETCDCGATFRWQREVTVDWYTWPKKDEQQEGN